MCFKKKNLLTLQCISSVCDAAWQFARDPFIIIAASRVHFSRRVCANGNVQEHKKLAFVDTQCWAHSRSQGSKTEWETARLSLSHCAYISQIEMNQHDEQERHPPCNFAYQRAASAPCKIAPVWYYAHCNSRNVSLHGLSAWIPGLVYTRLLLFKSHFQCSRRHTNEALFFYRLCILLRHERAFRVGT